MRKLDGMEDRFLFFASAVSFLAAIAASFLGRNSTHNLRIQYAVRHLPLSLVGVGLFFLLAAFAKKKLATVSGWSTPLCLTAIVGVFGLFWLPAWLAGGFVADDWLLLAGASVRKIIYAHPGYSWYALDTVDGNFRPLGTVLYFGYLLKWFGISPHIFTLGPFLLVLLAGFVIFAIVRELGYSRLTRTAAALLFVSRGMIYTIATWASALGDGIAILFCGLTSLFVLRANRSFGPTAVAYHFSAWLCFIFAALGKQSALVAPLIVALLLFMRPGERSAGSSDGSSARRAAGAATAFCVYAGTAAAIFLHAKSLSQGSSPYPIRFSVKALLQSFSYVTWYFLVIQFPGRHPAMNLLPAVLGMVIVIGGLVLARRTPGLLGARPRDAVFACLAAGASISLFIFLGTRSAPYYGCMAAFWLSIALGIVLTRPGRPETSNARSQLCASIFCVLIVSGFVEVRLEQTGLIPTGGYLWGTLGMDTEKAVDANLQRQLSISPQARSLVLIDCPGIPYTAMALLDAPNIQRVLLYNSYARTYTANDRLGRRPVDGFAGLNDPGSYNWTQPLDRGVADGIVFEERELRLACRDGSLTP